MRLKNIPTRGLGNHRSAKPKEISAQVREMEGAKGDNQQFLQNQDDRNSQNEEVRNGDHSGSQTGEMIEDIATNRSYSMAAKTLVDNNSEFKNWLTNRSKADVSPKYADIGSNASSDVTSQIKSDPSSIKNRAKAAFFKGPIDAMEPGISLSEKTDRILDYVGVAAPSIKPATSAIKAGKQAIEQAIANNGQSPGAHNSLLQGAQLNRLLAAGGAGNQARSDLRERQAQQFSNSEMSPS